MLGIQLEKFNNSMIKRLAYNFISLTGIKFIDSIIPVLLVPYVIKICGVENYGVYALLQTVALFFVFILDYSLATVGVQKVALFKSNKNKLSRFISNIIILKFFSVIFIITSVLVYMLFSLSDKYLISCFLMIVSGGTFINLWYYQGVEKYRSILLLSIAVKMVGLFFVFLLIKESSDFGLFLDIQGAVFLLIGGGSLFLQRGLIFKNKISVRYIKAFLFSVRHIAYYSIINASIQPIINMLINTLSTTYILGIYNICQRFLGLMTMIGYPLSNALLPIISEKKKSISYIELLKVIRKYLIVVTIYSSVLACLFFVFYLLFINYFIKEQIVDYTLWITYGVIFSVLTVPCISNQYITQMLHLLGVSKRVNIIVFYLAIVSVSSSILLLHYLSNVGAAVSALIMPFMLYFSLLVFLKNVKR